MKTGTLDETENSSLPKEPMFTICCKGKTGPHGSCNSASRWVRPDGLVRAQTVMKMNCADCCQLDVLYVFTDGSGKELERPVGSLLFFPVPSSLRQGREKYVVLKGPTLLKDVFAEPRSLPAPNELRDTVRRARGEYVAEDLKPSLSICLEKSGS